MTDEVSKKNNNLFTPLTTNSSMPLSWLGLMQKVAGRAKDFMISEVCRLLMEEVQENLNDI